MRRHLLAPLAAGLALLGACQFQTPGPQAAITLTVGRESYRPGEALSLGLRNASTATWGYNACMRTLEREVSGGWQVVAEPDRMCTMQLAILNGGETTTATTNLPASLPAGRYRVALDFSKQGTGTTERTSARGGPFTVAP